MWLLPYMCNLWTCGYNEHGQLSLNDNVNREQFIKVSINNKFIIVSCGHKHTAALDDEGKVWTYGDNECGQLG